LVRLDIGIDTEIWVGDVGLFALLGLEESKRTVLVLSCGNFTGGEFVFKWDEFMSGLDSNLLIVVFVTVLSLLEIRGLLHSIDGSGNLLLFTFIGRGSLTAR
jgi:hypothetical protein